MKGALSIRGISKRYGDALAVREVSLEAKPGEFVTLLGPSGCGKTTLLRLVAGFERPDAGSVSLSGQDVTALPAHKRPVNTVFQHYALFPHRSVFGNVAFGLEVRGVPPPETRARVEAALDPKLRHEMQVELKNLQERLGITFLFVTHDQDEALVMADRIAVMSHGRIEQLDGPEQLYEKPRTRFVADFMGVANLFRGTVEGLRDGLARVRTESGLVFDAAQDGGYRVGAAVWLGLRSERISLTERSSNVLEGTIDDEIFLGDWTDWRVRVGATVLSVGEGNVLARARRRGDAVTLSFPPEAVLRLEDRESAP